MPVVNEKTPLVIQGRFNNTYPLCRVLPVLNLLSQVGVSLEPQPWLKAYRFVFQRPAPLYWVLAQNAGAASRAQQVAYFIPFLQEAVKVFSPGIADAKTDLRHFNVPDCYGIMAVDEYTRRG